MMMNHPAPSASDTVSVHLPEACKHTITLHPPQGPLVVDVWEPHSPIDAPPILLIHGWGGTGTYWEDTAAQLSRTVPVVVPDLPGTGRSQPVNTAQNLFDQVNTLLYLLDTLSLDQVQVVGHSMGSAMALLVSDAQPDRVERLLLTSLSFFVRDLEEQVYRTVMKVFRVTMMFRPDWLADVPGLSYMMASRYFHHIPKNDDLLRRGFLDYLQLDGATAAACAHDAPTKAIPAAGARVHVPTLLVACRQDRLMPPQNVDYTVEHIPGSQVIWIEDCGHMPMLEKPAEFHAILRDFLNV